MTGALALAAATVPAQGRPDIFQVPLSHPTIAYTTAPTADRISRLNKALAAGTIRLPFDPASGYLRGVLAATGVAVESQLLVFSQTSAQADHISFANPRAIYFDDDLAVGWVRGAEALEVAVHDPRQGAVFYTLAQRPTDTPQFRRDNGCLLCHAIFETHGVPGFQVLSTFPMANADAYASGVASDHGTPFPQRWGGWFVTGRSVPAQHLGNLPVVRPVGSHAMPEAPVLASVQGQFDLAGFPTDTSDIVALLVLEHQARVANALTWLGWEARVAEPTPAGRDRVAYVAREVVDDMLLVGEVPLGQPVEGTSGFARRFVEKGRRDRQGRSLRDLDLQTRLFRYPCSYMIDSAAFAALPPEARLAVYARLREVLSGAEGSPRYADLAPATRQAIVEILRDTRDDLPAGW